MGISTEQWKDEGDCSVCRRSKYCTKKCSANKKADERAMKAAFTKALLNAGMRRRKGL